MTINGTTGWTNTSADSVTCDSHSDEIGFQVRFTNGDWKLLQGAYGWAALQYQAWARGWLTVPGDRPQTLILYTDHVLEFYVDDQHYFGGDFYAFRKAPLVLHLEPGSHRLDLRLIRDVRAMGGVGGPTVDVTVKVILVEQALHIQPDSAILPDFVDGKLAGRLGSIAIRNDAQQPVLLSSVEASTSSVELTLVPDQEHQLIVPGQTRPVAFKMTCNLQCPEAFDMEVRYTLANSSDLRRASLGNLIMRRTSIYEPHKITFAHPGARVSYAILRPPSNNSSCPNSAEYRPPLLLQFHGAGLEAQDPMVSHALNVLPDLCAFVLFPTGVTPWSGDDWHQWGFADVEAAIASLDVWLKLTDWQGLHPDKTRWLISGHSNGGQGTWYALTHRPDNAIAAAPVSGYSSIQSNLPFCLSAMGLLTSA